MYTILNKDNELEHINLCVVDIASTSPYDTSKYINNITTNYTRILYSDLNILLECLKFVLANLEQEVDVININLLYVSNSFKLNDIKIMFRFLCSHDCKNGEQFINKTLTELVYKFIKFVTKRTNTIIEISDHSMGAFFNNWDDKLMELKKPIKIKENIHCGKFKMYGNKKILLIVFIQH